MKLSDFNNMSPQKAAFLLQLISESKTKSKAELLPFLFGLSSRIERSGFSFSDKETQELVHQLTAGFSPAEQKRVEMLRTFSQMLSSKKKS